jgi:hypothetical protein
MEGLMKRDMDLIRELLLKLEEFPLGRGDVVHISLDESDPDDDFRIDGYTIDQIEYHLNLIGEAGLIIGAGENPMEGILFRSLSWEGHDFLDSIRDPEVWRKTKSGVKEVGGFTFELVKDLAKGFVKKQIEAKTGIAL